MKKRKLKGFVIYSLYFLVAVSFCTSIYFVNKKLSKTDNFKYVGNPIIDKEVPVVKEENTLIKPYKEETINILSNYYDYKGNEESQIKSIIFYNGSYLQNSGVIYGSDQMFDVVSIYDGEVIKVNEENIGKTIEIRHSNDVISMYQILGDTKVTVNQQVKQGDVIGISGQSDVIKDKQLLYFQLAIRGQLVNAEEYYGKKISEI